MSRGFSLADRVVLVTGASRGLGWAIAEAMAAAGGHVVLNGRDRATLEARAETLRGRGHAASVAPFDVTDEAAVARGVHGVVVAHGGIDALVANAGINHRAPVENFALADWRRVVDTNLTGAFTVARAAAAAMIERGHGRIVMMGSIMGRAPRPTIAAYAAAKGGVAALTRALAVELGPRGITCNAIAPGYVVTDMTADLADDADFDAWLTARTPLGRWGRAEEIASAAVFLASDAGAYINGHVLVVDGGLTAGI